MVFLQTRLSKQKTEWKAFPSFPHSKPICVGIICVILDRVPAWLWKQVGWGTWLCNLQSALPCCAPRVLSISAGGGKAVFLWGGASIPATYVWAQRMLVFSHAHFCLVFHSLPCSAPCSRLILKEIGSQRPRCICHQRNFAFLLYILPTLLELREAII